MFRQSIHQGNKGFTLIEIIIASAIITIIAGGAYASMRAAVATQKMVQERNDSMQTARTILNMIRDDLRATIPMLGESEFLGLNRTLGEMDGDNLDFATRNYSYSLPGESDFSEVSYFVTPGPGANELSLMRRRDPTPDNKPLEGGRIEILASGIKSINYQYYDGIEWFDDWGSIDTIKVEEDSLLVPGNLYGIPSAIRITIVVGKPSDPEADPTLVENQNRKDEPPAVLHTTVFIHASTLIEQEGAGNLEGSVL